MGGLAGVAFVVLFAAAVITINGPGGDFQEHRADVVAYGEEAHSSQALIGMALAGLGAIALIRFCAALAERIAGGAARQYGAWLVLGSGTAASAAVVIGFAMWAAVPIAARYGNLEIPSAELGYFLGQMGSSVLFLGAFVLLSSMWLAITMHGAAAMPLWIRPGSLVAAMLPLIPLGYLSLLVLVWVLVVSGYIAVHPTRRRHEARVSVDQ